MSITSNPQEVVKSRSTADTVADLAKNAGARLPGKSAAAHAAWLRLVALSMDQKESVIRDALVERGVDPDLIATLFHGTMIFAQIDKADHRLVQNLRSSNVIADEALRAQAFELIDDAFSPPPKTSPASVPDEPEHALTDAFKPDGTVSTKYASRKYCLILMVNTDTRLSRLEGRVMVQLLIKYLNMETNTAWPAIETLARELGADRRSIQRTIRRLTDLGWLEVGVGGGKRCTSTYHFPLPPGVVSLATYPWYERR